MVSRPRTSAAQYAGSHLSMTILTLLSASGFSRSSKCAADLLSEVTQRFVQLLGTTCVQQASHAGRTVIAPQDLRSALEHIMGGDPVEELMDWADQEGRVQLDNINARTTSSSAVTFAAAGPSSDPLQDPMRGKDLIHILRAGRVLPASDEIYFGRVESAAFEEMAAESLLREHASNEYVWPDYRHLLVEDVGMDSDNVPSSLDSDSAPSSPTTSIPSPPVSVTLSKHVSTDPTSMRQYGETLIDYVPSYLPHMPHRSTDPEQSNGPKQDPDDIVPSSVSIDVDPEYIADEQKRTEAIHRQAQEQAHLSATKADGGEDTQEALPVPIEKTAEERALEAEQALEALPARRVLRDSWREAVSFPESTLAVSFSKQELVEVESTALAANIDTSMSSMAPPTSSLRAFANAFQALSDDPTSSGSADIYVTPSGGAYQDAATKRRRLAHAIADASRYTPSDSLYASVAARPPVLPFQPGPSWLVSTLPPPTLYEDNVEVATALSTPMLTPYRPQGRPAALLPASGALVPTLGYRHPSHLSIGARVVSSSELLKKLSRYDDPAPLLDEKRVERFFHGAVASRDLLGGSGSSSDLSSNISSTRSSGGGGSGSGNSTLRPALERLVLQMKAKEAEILPEEDKEELQRRQQELQLQLQAAMASENSGGGASGKDMLSSGLIADSYASRIRNGNITLVHTWDWAVRDPYDPSLPGKKIRAVDRKPAPPLAWEKKARRDTLLTNTEPSTPAVNGHTQDQS